MRGDGPVFEDALLHLEKQGSTNSQYPKAVVDAHNQRDAGQIADGLMRPFSEEAVAAAEAAAASALAGAAPSAVQGHLVRRRRARYRSVQDDRRLRAEAMLAANSAVAGVEEGVVDVQPGVARSLSPDNRRRSWMKDLEKEDGGCGEEWCGGLRRLFSPQPTKQV